MIKAFKQQGFALLEILIAVIVILGLTLWWVKEQAHNNDVNTATQLSQQINQVLNAAVNYYTDHAEDRSNPAQWPLPNSIMSDLIADNYLTPNAKFNPYNNEIVLSQDSSGAAYEVLTTNLPLSKAYIANKAIESLTNATVSTDAKNATITVKLPEPAAFNMNADAVKYMTAVSANTYIPFDVVRCPLPPKNAKYTYNQQIFTSIQACTGTDHLPAEACTTYAEKTPDPSQPSSSTATGWTVHVNVLTETGWVKDPSALNQIQVAAKCTKIYS